MAPGQCEGTNITRQDERFTNKEIRQDFLSCRTHSQSPGRRVRRECSGLREEQWNETHISTHRHNGQNNKYHLLSAQGLTLLSASITLRACLCEGSHTHTHTLSLLMRLLCLLCHFYEGLCFCLCSCVLHTDVCVCLCVSVSRSYRR